MSISRHCLFFNLLFNSLLALTTIASFATAQTTTPNEWAWMSGSGATPAVGSGFAGVYGTLRVSATGNTPGSRAGAWYFTDSSGRFWLFGGVGYDSSGTQGFLNDLWVFDPSTREWTWMGGASTVPSSYSGQPGVYGTLGAPNAANLPGGRAFAAGWMDGKGNLWMFGGEGADATGLISTLNDLWEFNPSTNEWAWMSGSNTYPLTGTKPGVYGTMGTPAPTNVPGSRETASSWTDAAGNLWLFGGDGLDANSVNGLLNDLWEFDTSTNQWTWISGSSTLVGRGGRPGVYGAMGTPAPENTPGSRYEASSWADRDGNLWLFGGYGEDSNSNWGFHNDLWKFDPSTQQWTWMTGSSTFGQTSGGYPAQPGAYGAMWAPAAGNTPGSRYFASTWTDSSGYLWLFGGYGIDTSGNNGFLNDLWAFDLSRNEWAWIGGSSTIGTACGNGACGQLGVYGKLGIPAADNTPGGRAPAANWTDSDGNFWLFGGADDHTNSEYGDLNDLWKYSTPLPTAAPEFSLASGSYTGTQTLTISDATAGAAIYYTTDGKTTPTASSTLYSGAISVPASETIQAVAVATNHLYSDDATATYTITVVPDFSVAASPASFTLNGGQSGTTNVSVTPVDGFSSAVSFSCSGLPTGATCLFSPSTVTPAGGAASTTLTIATTTSSSQLRGTGGPVLPIAACTVLLGCFGLKGRRRLQCFALFAVAFLALGFLNGCGGSSTPTHQPVTSTITIIATSGSLQHSTTLSLTVN